jgi:hypothetical protein
MNEIMSMRLMLIVDRCWVLLMFGSSLLIVAVLVVLMLTPQLCVVS